jgi:hypothetical protein
MRAMSEIAFEFGARLAVAAFAVVGLACMLVVGGAAVLLALARRSDGGGDDANDPA